MAYHSVRVETHACTLEYFKKATITMQTNVHQRVSLHGSLLAKSSLHMRGVYLLWHIEIYLLSHVWAAAFLGVLWMTCEVEFIPLS